ncbi:MAG: ABC transporter ATP-binding protein [Planctomycetes bacterium]|nr:ABC transporter ATP-binding protein [Planctomycetota bacterium]MCL4730216.1 ABC transporter ATP-binding protein [Planctomycetota bacterium]
MTGLMDAALETRGLSKVYRRLRRIRALEPLDLAVAPGTVFGLLGANGAGKSTLVKTVLGICRATTGHALIFGKDSRDPAARREVGYLPEGTHFARYLSGRDVLWYFGRLAGLTGTRLREQVDAKLRLVGMADWADKKVSQYSKGMRQRIGLAQAMLGDPRLIILDEPTDGVDPEGRHHIRDVIIGLGKQGVTLFLNSHMLSEVESVCHEIAIMYQGRVLKRGRVQDIRNEMSMRDGKYQLVFRTGPLPSQLPPLLAGLQREDHGFRIAVADREEIPRLIDALRDSGVAIYGVEQYHASLEEAFLRVMDDGNHHGVGGTRQ